MQTIAPCRLQTFEIPLFLPPPFFTHRQPLNHKEGVPTGKGLRAMEDLKLPYGWCTVSNLVSNLPRCPGSEEEHEHSRKANGGYTVGGLSPTFRDRLRP